jgi:succinyl-CoA synthetase alpha subunit
MAILAGEETRILIQGITGREATSFARESLAYGARVVAGTTPGRGGSEVHGIPVYDCVRDALREHQVDASVVSVPPAFAKEAALEAISNGIGLIVIVTERMPRRDAAEVIGYARQKGIRLIGPDSMGLICPGRTRIGFMGGPASDARRAYRPGPVGVMSRSGGMTTELASLLTSHGLGQSTCVNIGGDVMVGTTFVDLMPLYEQDPETRALVIFGEPGGSQEEALAQYVASSRGTLPIVAFIAGRFVDSMPGRRFGHAGAMVEGDVGTVRGKIALLREAGVTVADRLSDVPRLVRERL